MNQNVALAIGAGVVCFWPLLWFVAGWWLARRGWPLEVRWRGWRDDRDEE